MGYSQLLVLFVHSVLLDDNDPGLCSYMNDVKCNNVSSYEL